VTEPNPEPDFSDSPAPQALDPRLQMAAQQEQQEANNALMQHLQNRVPVLRAQLNIAQDRIAELERELAAAQAALPQDHKPRARQPRAARIKNTEEKK
jgi:predicted  nucleic acid-binding Zn-ribbon protein